MYSPTTRLLTVLELLQSHKQMSGTEIARRLEIDVRTVRRYIVMLQDMGIPVEAERGPHGAYHLERGTRLPPLLFTDTEAIAITLGLLAIREFNFPVDVASVEGALAKTERVLPENVLHQARSLQEAIVFNVSPYIVSPSVLQNDLIVTLSAAVQKRQRIHLKYRSFSGDETEREFDAYGIVFNEGYWYTAGYCHARQDIRTFRLDRIINLESRSETFERPDDFDVLAQVLDSVAYVPNTKMVEVILHTSMERAQEAITPIMGRLEATEDGIMLRRSATQLEWVAFILLSLDFPVFVKEPPELRELLRQMAAKATQMIADKL